MKLRRSAHHAELSTLPLDAVDMFLLSRVEGELSLEELVDLSPCSAEETALRVEALVAAALLEVASSRAAQLESYAGVPELEEPVLDDAGLELASEWASDLADPAAELAWPTEAPTRPTDVLFDADPPSTLLSVFNRRPGEIEIQTLPSSQAQARTSEGSNVFRKTTVLELALDDDEDLAAKRK